MFENDIFEEHSHHQIIKKKYFNLHKNENKKKQKKTFFNKFFKKKMKHNSKNKSDFFTITNVIQFVDRDEKQNYRSIIVLFELMVQLIWDRINNNVQHQIEQNMLFDCESYIDDFIVQVKDIDVYKVYIRCKVC